MACYALPSLSVDQEQSLDSMECVPPCRPCCMRSTNIAQLVQNIDAIVSKPPPGGLVALKECFMKLLTNAALPESEWAKYAFECKSLPYTRNLIATDNKNYTLLLLCWNAAMESKIHDHPGDGCYVKVLKGAIKETKYSLSSDGEIVPLQEITATADLVTYMHDTVGLHKIGNPHPTELGVTLHLYTPPYQTCRVWSGPGRSEPIVGKVFHYSTFGNRTTQPSSCDLSYYI